MVLCERGWGWATTTCKVVAMIGSDHKDEEPPWGGSNDNHSQIGCSKTICDVGDKTNISKGEGTTTIILKSQCRRRDDDLICERCVLVVGHCGVCVQRLNNYWHAFPPFTDDSFVWDGKLCADGVLYFDNSWLVFAPSADDYFVCDDDKTKQLLVGNAISKK